MTDWTKADWRRVEQLRLASDGEATEVVMIDGSVSRRPISLGDALHVANAAGVEFTLSGSAFVPVACA